MHLKINIDGAARGNPGPAAFAYVISRPGGPDIEESGCLGKATNNVAEYTALVRALERAAALGGEELQIHSDSELLVKQMNGQYRVKNPDLRVLYDRAKELIEQFEQVAIRHVRREHNSRADELCNQALDGASLGGNSLAPFENHLSDAVREKAIAHLRSAAASWAKGDTESPPPEVVWDDLWRL